MNFNISREIGIETCLGATTVPEINASVVTVTTWFEDEDNAEWVDSGPNTTIRRFPCISVSFLLLSSYWIYCPDLAYRDADGALVKYLPTQTPFGKQSLTSPTRLPRLLFLSSHVFPYFGLNSISHAYSWLIASGVGRSATLLAQVTLASGSPWFITKRIYLSFVCFDHLLQHVHNSSFRPHRLTFLLSSTTSYSRLVIFRLRNHAWTYNPNHHSPTRAAGSWAQTWTTSRLAGWKRKDLLSPQSNASYPAISQ